MRSGPALVAVTATVVLAPGSASGAPPWSEPSSVGTALAVYQHGVSFAADGSALLYRNERTHAGRDQSVAAWRSASGSLGPVFALPGPLASPPVPLGVDRLGVLSRTSAPERVVFESVQAGGQPGGSTTLAKAAPATNESGSPSEPDIAARRGALAVAWTERRVRVKRGNVVGSERIRLALAPRRARFGRPRTVVTRPPFGLGAVALTFDGSGAVVVAFAAVGRGGRSAAVFVRSVSPGGRLGPMRSLGPTDPSWGMDLHASTGRDGTVAVAWGSRPAAECFTSRNVTKRVFAAIRPAGARAFRRARQLAASPVESCESRSVGLVVGDDGRSTVAWSMWDDAQHRSVDAAVVDTRGRVIASDRLGAGDFGSLAQAPDGTAILTWDDAADPAKQSDEPYGAVGAPAGHTMAALRPPGSLHFGVPEQVSGDEQDAGPASAAFDPSTGVPLLLWFGYPTGAPLGSDGSLLSSSRAP